MNPLTEILKPKYIYPVIGTILVYAILGTIFIAYGTTIYDFIPQENITIDNQYNPRAFEFEIHNNAALSLPFVTPPFFVSVFTENLTNGCYVETKKGRMDCNSTYLDLGFIETNKPQKLSLLVNQKTANDFSVNFVVSINPLVGKLRSGSKQIECKLVDKYYNTYTCR